MAGETEIVKSSQGTMSVADMKMQVNHIQKMMSEIMKDGEHYGVIPGTQKPTLLKAGAEKLCLTFRLDPEYDITERYEDTGDGRHLSVTSKCIIHHIPSGLRMGSGFGSCSTFEKKYAYRDAQRKCPACGKEAIIKGKEEYGGGWLCFGKKGGCGTKYPDGSPEIEEQKVGQIANPDLADLYNTVLKMANKRSLVAAVLNVTAASDIFTQDLEEMAPLEQKGDSKPATAKPASAPSQPAQQPKAATTTVATPGVAAFDSTKEYTDEEKAKMVGSLPAAIKKLMYSIGIDNPQAAWEVYSKCHGRIDEIKKHVDEALKKGAATT